MDDFLEYIGLPSIVLFVFLWALTFGIYKYDVEIAHANIVKVYRGEEKIYEGKQAFISVDSGGMTTTVHIYSKLYPFNITKAVYSDKDIKVE